ncbi:hypothetical protein MMC13_003753 [Lambiella insularis]|nr:hypothetical protein [Lambiella insularis]
MSRLIVPAEDRRQDFDLDDDGYSSGQLFSTDNILTAPSSDSDSDPSPMSDSIKRQTGDTPKEHITNGTLSDTLTATTSASVSESSPTINSDKTQTDETPRDLIKNGTYLSQLPKATVFAIIIDAFRLRVHDEREAIKRGDLAFQLPVGSISIHSRDSSRDSGPARRLAHQSPTVSRGLAGFKQYLHQAELRGTVLPTWWDKAARGECEALAKMEEGRLDEGVDEE